MARETVREPREVVATATNNLSPAAAVDMPSLYNLKRQIRRIRQGQDQIRLGQPRILEELEIPAAIAHLENGENFVLYDNGPEAGNMR